MAKNRELDVLANLFNKLSDEEREDLLDLINNKKPTKEERPNHFFEMDFDNENTYREASKKLNKTAEKNKKQKRTPVKYINVACQNCGKTFNLPENYPNIKNFICCI